MESARLKIPYVVLSNVMNDDRSLERRIQTPIGSVDIFLYKGAEAKDAEPSGNELFIEADMLFDPASLPAVLSNGLYENLANFSYDIAYQTMLPGACRLCALCLRFKNSKIVKRFIRDWEKGCWQGL